MIATLFSLLALIGAACAAEDVEALGLEKLEHLREESAAGNGLVKIAGSDFEKYVTKGPRPYYVVVILTALESGNCSPCEQVAPEIIRLGETIEEQRRNKKDDDETPDLFLIEADFLSNRNTFQKLSLQTAPMIIMVPPARTKKEISLSKLFKTIGSKHQYSLVSGRQAENIAEWINKQAKQDIQFAGSAELPDWALAYGIPVVLGVIGAWYVGLLDKARKNMTSYAFLSILAYGFFIGGGWFSIIRETPWVHVDKGEVSYISHMSRYQYTLEGYIVGGVNLLAGIGAFLYINAQRHGYERDGNGKIISRWWMKLVPVWIPFVMIVIGWYCLMYFYTMKNGHYNFGRVGMRG